MINNGLLRSAACAITASFGLSACAGLNDSHVKILPVIEIYSASVCNINEQGITTIKDKKHLQKVLIKANAHQLDSKPVAISSINFGSSDVLLIAMGTKSNTGYSLTRTGNEARMKDGALHLPIQAKSPSKDGMYGQMITSPCLVLSLPAGTYDTINIEGMDTL
jgi:hypothetical protein